MQAIVLVGGLGTRLRSVVPDLPKPMAPIQDKPFLAHLLAYLKSQGITDVIFPVHYLAEKITAYFKTQYAGLNIQYIAEEQALGTGGAIVNALSLYTQAKENKPLFVLNGDTFVKLNYQAMMEQHLATGAEMTMALRAVGDCSRYGKVMIEESAVSTAVSAKVKDEIKNIGITNLETKSHRVVGFNEKGEAGPGLINAGVYIIQPQLFARFNLPRVFSVENDFLLPLFSQLNLQAFIAEDYFIDIGIPEDYARAVRDFSAW